MLVTLTVAATAATAAAAAALGSSAATVHLPRPSNGPSNQHRPIESQLRLAYSNSCFG